MICIKASETLTKSKKINNKQNKVANKLNANVNDKKSFDNVISDINLDLMKIHKNQKSIQIIKKISNLYQKKK